MAKFYYDEDGDICFSLFRVFHWTKYKGHVLFRIGRIGKHYTLTN